MDELSNTVDVTLDSLSITEENTTMTLHGEDRTHVIVRNWPPFVGPKDARKLCHRLGVSPKKICPLKDHVYLTFENNEMSSLAVEKLNRFTFKKYTLKAKQTDRDCSNALDRMKRHGENDSEESDSVNITDVVTPWHDVSYEEQLERKHANCLAFLKDVSLAMAVAGKETIPSSRHYGILEDIRASPKENGYRNKCEFSVGYNNGYAEIGFRLTRHREGCTVAAVDDCKHIPTVMKSVVRQFRNFILSSGKAPYDVDTKEGFWRMLTVRCYEEGTLIIITVNPSGLDATCIAEIKKEVVNHFLYQDMTTLPISSIYYQELLNSSDEPRYELLSGSAYVYEKLFDMRFCILPSVFFQVNTKGCEVLYSAVEELCKSTKADVLLDIFCGTGALGLCLAKNYKHVIGIDLNKEAIENAKANASANKINHCDYFCGQLENLIFNVLELDAVKGSKCVAVLTPTRAGIDQKIIIALRKCKAVLFLVYISCNIMRSKKNMIDLHRRPTKRFYGSPFSLVRVVPVDMFPMTPHYATLMLFKKVTLCYG